MVDWLMLGAYVLAVFLFLATPGPVAVMVINSSTQQGFWAGFRVIAGTNLASLILIGLSLSVIGGLLSISERTLLWLTLFGSVYLLNFAYQILKSSSQPIDAPKPLPKSDLSGFKEGFIVGISNPKDILFFIAFFPMFFQVADRPWLAMAILVGVWLVMDYVILSGYALIFSKITHPRLGQLISRISGLILAAVALYAAFMTAIKLTAQEKLAN